MPTFRAVLSAYLATDACPMVIKARLYELLRLLCLKGSDQGLSKTVRQILPAVEHIEKHPELNTSVSELAAMCYLSESQLRRRFMASYGQPPIAYRNSLRCRIACELLTSTELPVAEIAERVGFGNVSDFYRMFRKLHGIAPYEYKKSKA